MEQYTRLDEEKILRSVTSDNAHLAIPLARPEATIVVIGSERTKSFANPPGSDFADITAK